MPAGDTSASILVPKLLLGTRSEVVRRWRQAARLALSDGGWNHCMSPADLIDIANSDEKLILEESYVFRLPMTGREMLFFPVIPVLSEVAGPACPTWWKPSNRRRWYDRLTTMVLKGAEHFWFCLGILACKSQPLFPLNIVTVEEEQALALSLLDRIAPWFDTLCQLHERFEVDSASAKSWLRWGMVAWRLCGQAGMAESRMIEIRDMDAAGASRAMTEWISEQKMKR